MTVTPDQFSRQMSTLATRMERNVTGSVGRAAGVVKASVQANLRAKTGDNRMSGVGKKGAKVGVTYSVRGGKDPSALLRATGPVHLIERDTTAHTILPRGVGRAQGRSKLARRAAKQNLYDALFGGRVGSGVKPLSLGKLGLVRYSVKHPGTKGSHPFEKGVERATPTAQRLMAGAVTKSLGEVFKV